MTTQITMYTPTRVILILFNKTLQYNHIKVIDSFYNI